MELNDRPQNRAYSPYTVDSPEVGSRNSNALPRSYLNLAYENSGVPQSHEKDDVTNRSTFKEGDLPRSLYENSKLDHQYEDPFNLVICKSAWSSKSTGPKRKDNSLYESTELKKQETDQESTSTGDRPCGVEMSRDSWISRLILFLILMVSLTSLVLVVLIIIGKLGPSCCSGRQGEVLTKLYRKKSLPKFW